MNVPRTLTHEQWLAEGAERYGDDVMQWRFVCPSCGHEASVQDWKDAGASEGEVAFSCVGRHLPGTPSDAFAYGDGPCNYAGGGLFKINPVQVLMPPSDGDTHAPWHWRPTFEFASAYAERMAREADARDAAQQERAEEFR